MSKTTTPTLPKPTGLRWHLNFLTGWKGLLILFSLFVVGRVLSLYAPAWLTAIKKSMTPTFSKRGQQILRSLDYPQDWKSSKPFLRLKENTGLEIDSRDGAVTWQGQSVPLTSSDRSVLVTRVKKVIEELQEVEAEERCRAVDKLLQRREAKHKAIPVAVPGIAVPVFSDPYYQILNLGSKGVYRRYHNGKWAVMGKNGFWQTADPQPPAGSNHDPGLQQMVDK